MKNSNKILTAVTLTFVLAIVYYIILIDHLRLWLFDIKSCFSFMNIPYFFIDHIHIFFYLFVFSMMSAFIIKGIVKNVLLTVNNLKFKNALCKISVKRYKNIHIIDIDSKTGFNFGNSIYISKKLLKQTKILNIVYQHEKKHLESKDFHRTMLLSVILNFFPESIKDLIIREFSLAIETEVDKKMIKTFDKNVYLKALISFYEQEAMYPKFNNYLKERIENILYEKDIQVKLDILILSLTVLAVLIFITTYIKTCFCGM